MSEGEAALGSTELGEFRLALDGVERLARQLTVAMMKQSAGAETEEK